MSGPQPPGLLEAELAERIRAQGYLDVRILSDGSIAALHDLLFTRAIMLGCDEWGYSRRFCFENRALADRRFQELQTEDDEPQGFIARR